MIKHVAFFYVFALYWLLQILRWFISILNWIYSKRMSFQGILLFSSSELVSRKANSPINICHVLLIHLFHLLTIFVMPKIKGTEVLQGPSNQKLVYISMKMKIRFLRRTFYVLYTVLFGLFCRWWNMKINFW